MNFLLSGENNRNNFINTTKIIINPLKRIYKKNANIKWKKFLVRAKHYALIFQVLSYSNDSKIDLIRSDLKENVQLGYRSPALQREITFVVSCLLFCTSRQFAKGVFSKVVWLGKLRGGVGVGGVGILSYSFPLK